MWFIFPQIKGLGSSSTARFYALDSIEETRQYWKHPVLGTRLEECINILLAKTNPDARAIFGYPDVLKLRSCLTLFEKAAENGDIFSQAIDRLYAGERDAKTLRILDRMTGK